MAAVTPELWASFTDVQKLEMLKAFAEQTPPDIYSMMALLTGTDRKVGKHRALAAAYGFRPQPEDTPKGDDKTFSIRDLSDLRAELDEREARFND